MFNYLYNVTSFAIRIYPKHNQYSQRFVPAIQHINRLNPIAAVSPNLILQHERKHMYTTIDLSVVTRILTVWSAVAIIDSTYIHTHTRGR